MSDAATIAHAAELDHVARNPAGKVRGTKEAAAKKIRVWRPPESSNADEDL